LLPGKNNHKIPSAYIDLPQKEDRIQFWKRIFSSAPKNDGDRLILQSNLNRLQKEVSSICGGLEIEQIELEPIQKDKGRRLLSIFFDSPFFNNIFKNRINHNDKYFIPIQDFLKSIETIMEIKNGNFGKKSSNS
jgi:hypothetical protein